MVLRLDPDVPRLWRSPTEVQFGVDRVVVRLEEVDLADERMLHALTGGVSRPGLQLFAEESGRPGADVRLLVALAPVIQRTSPAPIDAPPDERGEPGVSVVGTGPVAEGVAALLPRADDPDHPELAIVVADWVISAADAGTWLRRDVPHLAVVISDGIATIGPLVTPGRTPCLYCVHRARADADPAWPAIAAQLLGREPHRLSPVEAAGVSALVARIAGGYLAGRGLASAGTSALSLDVATLRRRVHAVEPHPDCGCGSFPGSVWAGGVPS